MRILTSAALGAAFLLSAAVGRELVAEECVPLAAVEAAAERHGIAVVHDLRGPDAAAWLADWNAVPPATGLAGDQVVLLDRMPSPDRPAQVPTVLVMVFADGCLAAWWEEGRGLVERITGRVVRGA